MNSMKKTAKFLIFLSIFLILIMPVFSFAADPLVPCGVKDEAVLAEHPDYSKPCGFLQFMALINGIIDFIFKFLALPIAAIMFAYAGVLLVTSAGSPESRTKAKSIFFSTFIGLALAAGAWIIVKTLLSILGYQDIGLFF